MGFLAPAFLLGALAIGLPLYLHLLRRQSGTQRFFSSLMFLEPREESAVRRRRLRYWLLLMLRIAVLLLVALAFAQPYFERAGAAEPPGRLLVLAIDDSFSMQAGERLAEAKREALDVLATRRPRDRAQVLSLSSTVSALTPITRDPGELRAAVRSIVAGDSRGSFAALAAAARSLAENDRTPIELHLFSDMQRTGMPPSFAEMALPGSVLLVLHPIAKTALPNWAVESVSAPGEVWSRTAHVQAVIAGYGTPAASRTVALVVNGRTVLTRQVQIPPSGRASIEFDAPEVPYGWNRCAVRIQPSDALPADDEYVFAIERSDPKRGLFVHQAADERSPLYFEAALRSADPAAFSLEKITPDRAAEVDPAPYAFVVLSDVAALPDAFAARLAAYVRRGGSVLVALGTAAAQARRMPLLGGPMLAAHDYSSEPEHFVSIGAADTTYPGVGAQASWEAVKFFYAVGVHAEGARVALRLADGAPLLLEKPLGEGRVVLLASSLDNLTNDLPLHPIFVAFVDRIIRYLSATEEHASARTVGDFIELRSSRKSAAGIEVVDPSGRRPFSFRAGATAERLQLTQAGVYDIHRANGRRELIAANPDRRESDLAPMPSDVLALWRGGTSSTAASGTREARTGATTAAGSSRLASGAGLPRHRSAENLWWYAMVLLLLAAVAESATAIRHLGTRRESP